MNWQELSQLGDLLAGVGGLLAGVAALVAAVAGAWAAKYELPRWREQTLEAKRADVAGHAIGAALRMLDALKAISSPFVFDEWIPDEIDRTRPAFTHRRPQLKLQRQRFEDEVNRRWTESGETIRDFYEALDTVRALLPPESIGTLAAIEWLARDIRSNQSMWLSPGVYGHREAQEHYRRGFNVGQKIEKLRDEMLRELRRHTLLSDHVPREKVPKGGEVPRAIVAKAIDEERRAPIAEPPPAAQVRIGPADDDREEDERESLEAEAVADEASAKGERERDQ